MTFSEITVGMRLFHKLWGPRAPMHVIAKTENEVDLCHDGFTVVETFSVEDCKFLEKLEAQ